MWTLHFFGAITSHLQCGAMPLTHSIMQYNNTVCTLYHPCVKTIFSLFSGVLVLRCTCILLICAKSIQAITFKKLQTKLDCYEESTLREDFPNEISDLNYSQSSIGNQFI